MRKIVFGSTLDLPKSKDKVKQQNITIYAKYVEENIFLKRNTSLLFCLLTPLLSQSLETLTCVYGMNLESCLTLVP